MSAVDVLAVLGSSRMETPYFANKAGISLASARRQLRSAQLRGEVVNIPTPCVYRRRGAAVPLIWVAARVGGAA